MKYKIDCNHHIYEYAEKKKDAKKILRSFFLSDILKANLDIGTKHTKIWYFLENKPMEYKFTDKDDVLYKGKITN